MSTGIQYATYKEAVPFIRNMDFKVIEEKPFPVYRHGSLYLIISGIGKTGSTLAAAYLISQYSIRRMINLGSAGSAKEDFKVGEILHINNTVEYDGRDAEHPKHKFLKPDIHEGFTSAVLVTSDYPVIKPEEREKISSFGELIDMEGAAFVQACRVFGAESFLFKIVSDTPSHMKLSEIVKNIKSTRDLMYTFFIERLQNLII